MDLLTLHSTEEQLKKEFIYWFTKTNVLCDEIEKESLKNPLDKEKILLLLEKLNEVESKGTEIQKKLKKFKEGIEYYD